jgi:hypothetical protein
VQIWVSAPFFFRPIPYINGGSGMNNRIMVGVLIIFFFVAMPAYSKPKDQHTQQLLSADDVVAKMKIQLELTDKQVGDVKPIIENYLTQEKQLKLEEKKQLSKVLSQQQLYSWNFLQNEPPPEKKKRAKH